MRIREIPLHIRPRERALREGIAVLSDAELTAILIRSGRKGASALDLAHGLLSKAGGNLSTLWQGDASLFRSAGVSTVPMLAIRSALELGHRLHRDVVPPCTLDDACHRLTHDLRARTEEAFFLIPLDLRNRCVGEPIPIGSGTRYSVQVEAREVLGAALRRGAARIVLVHNHPSGENAPSTQDILLTKQIREGAAWMDIWVWDHLIITADEVFSFREHGMLD